MGKPMKHAVSIMASALSTCASQVEIADYQRGGPTADQVERIEAQVVMPAGAQPLKRYLRTYFPDQGRIIGQYRLGSQPGIRSQPTPDEMVLDGGCSAVTLIFDPSTSTIEDVACNGVA